MARLVEFFPWYARRDALSWKFLASTELHALVLEDPDKRERGLLFRRRLTDAANDVGEGIGQRTYKLLDGRLLRQLETFLNFPRGGRPSLPPDDLGLINPSDAGTHALGKAKAQEGRNKNLGCRYRGEGRGQHRMTPAAKASVQIIRLIFIFLQSWRIVGEGAKGLLLAFVHLTDIRTPL